MEDPGQDVASPATSGTGKSKLETLPKEDLIKFAKRQMMLMQKVKSRCTELEKEIEEFRSKPLAGETNDVIQALTERLDAILLEKAEVEQHCLALKKENVQMKQETEHSITKMEDLQKEFEHSNRSYLKEIENWKTELTQLQSKYSKDRAALEKELEEAVKKQIGLSEELKFSSESQDDVKKLQEEIQRIKPAYEEQILYLKKQLEAITEEKNQEISDLQNVIKANSQHYQSEISSLQEELFQLKTTHKEEMATLMHQLEASGKEHEEERNKFIHLMESTANDENVQENSKHEFENLKEALNPVKENPVYDREIQEDTAVKQIVNEKVKHLEDSLKELESQHSMLKDEVTYMNNLKLKLEMDAQNIKDEFFHEREDLEFKVNELLLVKEDHCCIIEKLKSELEVSRNQFSNTVKQHNMEVQSLKEEYQKEISELKQILLSNSEKEKLTIMFEMQDLREQYENLQQEKQEAVLNYEGLRETMEILQRELGESAGKISQEFESMKQQQASDVHELQQKLRIAFNEKDSLIETVNRLKGEKEILLSKQDEAQEHENVIKSLQEKNEEIMISLNQKDITIQELQAKICILSDEKDDFLSKIQNAEEELDNIREECKRKEEEIVELKEKIDQITQYSNELEQKVKALTEAWEETLKEKKDNNQNMEKLEIQVKVLSEEQEKLSSQIKNLQEENERLNKEKDQVSKDLDTFISEKKGDISFKEQATELENKLQLAIEEKDNLDKLFVKEQTQNSVVRSQLYDFLKEMGSRVSEIKEEEDIMIILQAVRDSLGRMKEEKQTLVFQNNETVLQLQKENEHIKEENLVHCEELKSLLEDYEKERVLLKEELEGCLSEKAALQLDLQEMNNANEKTRLENQNLLAQITELSENLLCNKNEIQDQGKSSVEEQENVRLLLKQREAELRDVKAELTSLKDSLENSHSVKSDQHSVMELEDKIVNLEKESKEKEEKLSKIKVVALKARKELDSSRKEAQSLREELELVRSERDNLSTSMKDLIQGAEGYKNLFLEYDKQAEQLDMEKERANNFEHQIEDLIRQLKNSGSQCDRLSSDNEDLLARIETLQSNAKLLEAQILEVQRAKVIVDKELETEKLHKEQKIKEHTNTLKELEELQVQLQKEKKHLQKTMQELEMVRKDAQQTTLMDMEIADYERLVKELNQKITDKNSRIEDLEQEIKIYKQKQETLQEEMTSLQSSVQQAEDKNTRIKQLLVKTKKELADSKQAETNQLILQSSLKGELEASQQQVEVYKIQLAEITSEKHKIQEHLRTSIEQHQRALSSCHQKITILQEECNTTKAEQATITSEFESYKVRVHNVLKQQKNKSLSQSETEGAKQERQHLEMMIDQLKMKLQDTQNNLQTNASELQVLQSEHDTLLERHNKMLQETVTKEAELREKLCSVQSENMMMKSEHAQTVSQLTSQNETLHSNFRDQVRRLQEEHRKTMETLQQQLSKVEAQYFQLKSDPTTRSSASSHQPLKNLRDRRNTDLPLLEMHAVTREEGEGMETADTESVSSTSIHTPSLEQLLNSPETKLEPPLWHEELSKEELVQKLNSTTKSADHLNGLLRETEATNAILMEQIKLLKSEVRRLERNQEREKSVANLEYLKNVLLQFIFLKAGSERERLLPVIDTMLQLSPEEKGKLVAIAQGEEESTSRPSGWASYLHSWSGLR
ncbi:GRIP and coiled-coil domain-containing protein 2-like [Vombatus ursinus]|uniref:GRIP domain-containing protein n=3 Tax=Vombatus ursinus TaxID=29139 RepID=A0A4X2K9G5_VOMUR|nr:GRIP and coiled-coil domain-containing protein 2-like [Vombatus ursinus]XP_027722463.1 GRIP and coiled-coil domain-containing protein 2-like [Vombatus ursinus]